MAQRSALLLACAALVIPAASAVPHVVLIVADDLGWADCGFSGQSDVRTPRLDALASSGLRLTRYYGQPVCSPSRAAIHTGRLPLSYGLQTYVIDPNGVDYGLNLNETTIADVLSSQGGYSTHAVGKWHQGQSSWEQTPTFRGYDTFHGFYSGGQDYFTHQTGGENTGYDLHVDNGCRCGAGCSVVDWANEGVYSTLIYATAAVDIITAHDASTPLFLYLAFQAVHSPDQVPQSYIDPYNATIPDLKRRTFAGMLSALDEAVGNVTDALDRAGLRENTLILFVADNGGPIACADSTCGDATGASNFPLRGGKHSLWEGGVRLTAIANGRMLHAAGVNETGLMHHSDWFATLLEAAGVDYTPRPGFELHGRSAWGMLTRGEASSRNETVCNIDPAQPAISQHIAPGQGNAAIVTAEGWKLLLGLPGPPTAWSPPNSSAPGAGEEFVVPADAAAVPTHAHAAVAAPVPCAPSSYVPGLCLLGSDLSNAPAPTPAACCAACAALPRTCRAWTHNSTGAGMCFLKSSTLQPRTTRASPHCTSSSSSIPCGPLWPLTNMTPSLYNLTIDPEERHNVAAEHPEVVAFLTERLAVYGRTAAQPYWITDSAIDPASDPTLRNGTWTPWL